MNLNLHLSERRPRSRQSLAARARALAFTLLASASAGIAVVPAGASAQGVPGPVPLPWNVVARALVPPGEPDRTWDQCDANHTTAIAGVPYIGATVHCRFMLVDGTPRRFVVYTPRAFMLAEPPVVLVFHGSAQHGEHFLIDSTWRTLADRFGFVVAFPTGLEYKIIDPDTGASKQETKWNSYGLGQALDPAQPNWRPPQFASGTPWPANDVKFTTAIINDLGAQMPIDRCRIFATGFSNGGSFTGRLAVDIPQVLAAAAAVTGLFQEVFTPSEFIPMFFAQGTQDDNLLDAIEASGSPRPSTQDLLDPTVLYSYPMVVDRIGKTTSTFGVSQLFPATTSDAAPRTWLKRTWLIPAAGAKGRPLLKWKIWRGVEHEYPRSVLNPLGADNPWNFDAPVEFWDFFTRHPRPVCDTPIPGPDPGSDPGPGPWPGQG